MTTDTTPGHGKTLGKMTPAERAEVIKRAADKFQAELTASAPAIAKILDEFASECDGAA